MAKSKASENIVRMRCQVCKRVTYFTKKNKKKEYKLGLKKYCNWCRKHTLHKESKR